MFSDFVNRLFGRSVPSPSKSRSLRGRRLRIESLENRELLAVSFAEFEAIRTQYADIGLSADMTDYNVIEITANELSEAKIRDAIADAATTEQDDLIVIRTTGTQNKIDLDGTELTIDIVAADWGSVTIVSFGDERLTIDANNASRVFNIGEDATVALAGMVITKGNAPDFGGGIANEGILTVIQCTISDNVTANDGGGIDNFWGSLMVIDCTIEDNTANEGGGINNVEGILEVRGGAIRNNITNSNGAGISSSYTVDNEVISLKITDVDIEENHATGEGGGIFIQVGQSVVTGGTIIGNTAQSHGGGIATHPDAELTIMNCLIERNVTQQNGGGVSSQGDLTITNSTIIRNEANWRAARIGGGIYNSGILNVSNGKFTANEAFYGGGIYNAAQGQMTVADSFVTENHAMAIAGGGGIYNEGVATNIRTSVASNYLSDAGDVAGSGKYRQVLPSPEFVAVKSTDHDKIRVEWTAVPNAGGYEIQYSTVKDDDWTPWEPVDDPLVTLTTITGLDADTTYYVRILAQGSGNETYIESDWKDSGPVTTLLEEPTDFECIEGPTANSVTLQWSPAGADVGYEIRYRGDNGERGKWSGEITFEGGVMSATIDDLYANTSYGFQVRAVREEPLENKSKWANSVSVMTLLATPVILTTASTETTVTLTWQHVGADSYDICNTSAVWSVF